MDFEKLAKQIGSVPTGQAVTGADVEQELRSKSYVLQGGKLSASEQFRLGVFAKRRAIKRLVDEAFANDAAMAKQKPAPKRATRPLAMAKAVDPLTDPETQLRFKEQAWAVFRAGPIR